MVIKRTKYTLCQTLVEFALILPTLIFIIVGVFEFGRMLQVWITVQNCAQAAARYATTGQQTVVGDVWDSARLAAVKTEARNRAVTLNIQPGAGRLDPGYFQVYVYASDPPIQGGEYPGGPNARVAVDVVFNYPLMTPVLDLIAPYITLKAHSEMINERFRHPGYGTPVGRLPPTIFPTPTPMYTATNVPTATIPPPTFTATMAPATPTATIAPPTNTATEIPPTPATTSTAAISSPTPVAPTGTPTGPTPTSSTPPCQWWWWWCR